MRLRSPDDLLAAVNNSTLGIADRELYEGDEASMRQARERTLRQTRLNVARGHRTWSEDPPPGTTVNLGNGFVETYIGNGVWQTVNRRSVGY